MVYNDDTTVKILELMGERANEPVLAEDRQRIRRAKKRRIAKACSPRALFPARETARSPCFSAVANTPVRTWPTCWPSASKALAAPIQMCDALTRNLPGELETIVAHCLAHGRRRFVEVADHFPEECRYVLESLAVIYRNDAIARERKLSPSARRHFHQAQSGPTMERLHVWLGRQLEDRRVEPNSSLGTAISYLLKYWERLTLFLRVPGAPLDNNLCERALKRAILHRKNALFYKTCHGGTSETCL